MNLGSARRFLMNMGLDPPIFCRNMGRPHPTPQKTRPLEEWLVLPPILILFHGSRGRIFSVPVIGLALSHSVRLEDAGLLSMIETQRYKVRGLLRSRSIPFGTPISGPKSLRSNPLKLPGPKCPPRPGRIGATFNKLSKLRVRKSRFDLSFVPCDLNKTRVGRFCLPWRCGVAQFTAQASLLGYIPL